MAAVQSANSAITYMLAVAATDARNRRLKRAVKRTSFAVKMWEQRVTARGKAYEREAAGLQSQAQGLQSQAQSVERMNAQLQAWSQQQAARIQRMTDPVLRKEAAKEYRREFRTRKAMVEHAAEQQQSGASQFEQRRQGLKGFEKRYEQGTKRLKGMARQNERAVNRYNREYYPIPKEPRY
jgi:chromosome segregation ATPase